MPKIESINVNPAGGVPKHAVPSAFLGTEGVGGDRQRNRKFHGGPLRAVSLYSLEIIATLQSEGHPIAPGSTGENLTLSGLDWPALVPGTHLRLGAAVELEITSYVTPCKNIAASFCNGDFSRISQKLHPGESRLYARVLREGIVHVGDGVGVLRNP
ncbi:MAG: MOSC domain-containing protein [Chloroflexaceae bacterium]|jgi:MOSC domain-containing protein YiiM|nr:MOSC domain-containing protein [Chloroflexaceae bacterium]